MRKKEEEMILALKEMKRQWERMREKLLNLSDADLEAIERSIPEPLRRSIEDLHAGRVPDPRDEQETAECVEQKAGEIDDPSTLMQLDAESEVVTRGLSPLTKVLASEP